MDVFLQKLAGYVTAEEQMEPHSPAAPSVSRFVRYRKSQLSVSLTQAGVIGPIRVIACSDATADITFMTAGGLRLCTPNSHYTAKTCTASTNNRSTGESVELEHQRVMLLPWRLIRPFLEAHVVALVPRPGVQSQTMALMGFSAGTRATMSSEL
jgi:hypothetical protein